MSSLGLSASGTHTALSPNLATAVNRNFQKYCKRSWSKLFENWCSAITNSSSKADVSLLQSVLPTNQEIKQRCLRNQVVLTILSRCRKEDESSERHQQLLYPQHPPKKTRKTATLPWIHMLGVTKLCHTWFLFLISFQNTEVLKSLCDIPNILLSLQPLC